MADIDIETDSTTPTRYQRVVHDSSPCGKTCKARTRSKNWTDCSVGAPGCNAAGMHRCNVIIRVDVTRTCSLTRPQNGDGGHGGTPGTDGPPVGKNIPATCTMRKVPTFTVQLDSIDGRRRAMRVDSMVKYQEPFVAKVDCTGHGVCVSECR
jgi:hypothetical protein